MSRENLHIETYDVDQVSAQTKEILRLHPVRLAELKKIDVELTVKIEGALNKIKTLSSIAKADIDQFDAPQNKKLARTSSDENPVLLIAETVDLEAQAALARVKQTELNAATTRQLEKSNTPLSPRLFATPEATRKRERHDAEDNKEFKP